MRRIFRTRFSHLTIMLIVAVFGAFGCTKKTETVGEVGAKIQWLYDLDEALASAQQQDKPLMIDFMATWCPPCKSMEDSTFSNPAVIDKSNYFVSLRIDVDKYGDIADKYNANARKYNGVGIPNVLFMTADEARLKHVIGFRGPELFLAEMDSVLAML